MEGKINPINVCCLNPPNRYDYITDGWEDRRERAMPSRLISPNRLWVLGFVVSVLLLELLDELNVAVLRLLRRQALLDDLLPGIVLVFALPLCQKQPWQTEKSSLARHLEVEGARFWRIFKRRILGALFE